MKRFKKHIALFFSILFVVSQLNYAIHTVFEDHHQGKCLNHTHHHHDFEKKESVTTNAYAYKTIKEKGSFDELNNCTLCQQYQSFKLHFTESKSLKIDKEVINSYKTILHKTSLFSKYLLKNISLRGPPTTFFNI